VNGIQLAQLVHDKRPELPLVLLLPGDDLMAERQLQVCADAMLRWNAPVTHHLFVLFCVSDPASAACANGSEACQILSSVRRAAGRAVAATNTILSSRSAKPASA
jgi:hypothetical protein